MGGGIALQLALRHPEAIGGAFVPGSQGFTLLWILIQKVNESHGCATDRNPYHHFDSSRKFEPKV